MSLPTFPSIDPPMTTNDSLNMILASIAMEELGLSHIINAEGEKLQYVLGTLEGSPNEKASIDDVLAVNKSIKCLLDSVMQNQVILKGKMTCAIDALEGGGPCPPGPTGPTGPTGPRGPAGPKGEPGASETCRAISFPGCPGQCWCAGKPLIWSRSECSGCCSLYLSSDGRKIILGGCKCFVVSFSIDLCVAEPNCKCVAIGVQTIDGLKRTDRFVLHAPIIYKDSPFTASAGGIFIPTQSCSTELVLTLLSPDSVEVNQSSICVMEI